MKQLLKSIALLAALASFTASAQSIATTASVAPVAIGNSVHVTRLPNGVVQARGFTYNFESAVEFTSVGGNEFAWVVSGGFLYLKPNGSPYAPTAFYLCAPRDSTLQVIALYNIQLGALGLLNITDGQCYLGAQSGIIKFPLSNTLQGQCQFRFVRL